MSLSEHEKKVQEEKKTETREKKIKMKTNV